MTAPTAAITSSRVHPPPGRARSMRNANSHSTPSRKSSAFSMMASEARDSMSNSGAEITSAEGGAASFQPTTFAPSSSRTRSCMR